MPFGGSDMTFSCHGEKVRCSTSLLKIAWNKIDEIGPVHLDRIVAKTILEIQAWTGWRAFHGPQDGIDVRPQDPELDRWCFVCRRYFDDARRVQVSFLARKDRTYP